MERTPDSVHPVLGRRVADFRPTTWRFLFLTMVTLFGPGAIFILAALIAYNDPSAFGGILSNLLCFGLVGVLLIVLGAVIVSDYRAWRATRTIRLSIYENGIIHEKDGLVTSCRWDEIKLARTRWQTQTSKSGQSRRRVITAIVKTDGKVIKIPETINRFRITDTISELRGVPIKDPEPLSEE